MTQPEAPFLSAFCPEMRIATDAGARCVSELALGARVLTRDNGFQPLMWLGRSAATTCDAVTVPRKFLALDDAQASCIFGAHHRILLSDPVAELYFGAHEVFVEARHLGGAASPPPHNWVHLLFTHHEMVFAGGVWSETLAPTTDTALRLASCAAPFPECEKDYADARHTLTRREVKLLLAEIA